MSQVILTVPHASFEFLVSHGGLEVESMVYL